MATNYILDTSVVVKWFSADRENHLTEAHKLLADLSSEKIELTTLDLLLLELTNALVISKKLDKETSIASCKILLQSPIKFLPLSPQILFEATRLTGIYKVTIYDAVYLALAQHENTKVITADKIMGKIKKYTLFISEYR